MDNDITENDQTIKPIGLSSNVNERFVQRLDRAKSENDKFQTLMVTSSNCHLLSTGFA